MFESDTVIHAGVVDHGIERAQAPHGFVDGLLAGIGIAEVGDEGDALAELGADCGNGVGVTIDHDRPGAFGDKRAADRGTDTFGAAGNDHHAVVELEIQSGFRDGRRTQDTREQRKMNIVEGGTLCAIQEKCGTIIPRYQTPDEQRYRQ